MLLISRHGEKRSIGKQIIDGRTRDGDYAPRESVFCARAQNLIALAEQQAIWPILLRDTLYARIRVCLSVHTCGITTRLHMYPLRSWFIHKLHIRDGNDVYRAYRVCMYVCMYIHKYILQQSIRFAALFSIFFFFFFFFSFVYLSSDSSTRSREQLAGNLERKMRYRACLLLQRFSRIRFPTAELIAITFIYGSRRELARVELVHVSRFERLSLRVLIDLSVNFSMAPRSSRLAYCDIRIHYRFFQELNLLNVFLVSLCSTYTNTTYIHRSQKLGDISKWTWNDKKKSIWFFWSNKNIKKANDVCF